MNLLNTYLKLEEKINMELMLKERIFITYYEKLADFKNDMFILNDFELISFLDDYQFNKNKLTQEFIMLYDKSLDLYVLWTESDCLEVILDYFLNKQEYKKFII